MEIAKAMIPIALTAAMISSFIKSRANQSVPNVITSTFIPSHSVFNIAFTVPLSSNQRCLFDAYPYQNTCLPISHRYNQARVPNHTFLL